jgi:predicted  nucleic acid-binding Zn-ribbon protein
VGLSKRTDSRTLFESVLENRTLAVALILGLGLGFLISLFQVRSLNDELALATQNTDNSISELNQLLNEREAALEKQATELAETHSAIQATLEEVARLKIDLADAHDEATRTSTTNDELSHELATRQEQFETLTKQLSSVESELAATNQTLAEISETSLSNESLVAETRQDLEVSQERNSELSDLLDSANNTIGELTAEVERLRQENARDQDALAELDGIRKFLELIPIFEEGSGFVFFGFIDQGSLSSRIFQGLTTLPKSNHFRSSGPNGFQQVANSEWRPKRNSARTPISYCGSPKAGTAGSRLENR